MKPSELLSCTIGDVLTNGKDHVRVIAIGLDNVCVDISWEEEVVKDYIHDVSASLWSFSKNPPVKKGSRGYRHWKERKEEAKRWKTENG